MRFCWLQGLALPSALTWTSLLSKGGQDRYDWTLSPLTSLQIGNHELIIKNINSGLIYLFSLLCSLLTSNQTSESQILIYSQMTAWLLPLPHVLKDRCDLIVHDKEVKFGNRVVQDSDTMIGFSPSDTWAWGVYRRQWHVWILVSINLLPLLLGSPYPWLGKKLGHNFQNYMSREVLLPLRKCFVFFLWTRKIMKLIKFPFSLRLPEVSEPHF